MQVSESYLDPLQLADRLDRSLARLGTDYIDLYQIHWHSRAAVRSERYPDRPLAAEVALEATLRSLDDLRKRGLIRHIGVCNFGVADLRAAIATGVPIVSNQVCYNLLWRGIETELVPLCVKHNIAILPWSPLQQGILTGKFETADAVPEGRKRSRLFSGKRPFARHGEAGLEDLVFAALDELRHISVRPPIPPNSHARTPAHQARLIAHVAQAHTHVHTRTHHAPAHACVRTSRLRARLKHTCARLLLPRSYAP
jgi:aryl-alcohol dehydrogenase-like predicted oxidoreductase